MEERTVGYELIKDAAGLAKVAQRLGNVDFVGTDTETTGLNPREGRARLLQLAVPNETFVVDLFAVGDLSPLREVLEDGPTKALHNAKFDHAFLHALHGIDLHPVFDTMLASQLLAGGDQTPSHSLEAVAERHAGLTVDKAAQRTDWSGSLSEEQVRYAARDAAVLLPLREALAAELEEEGLGRVARIEFGAVAAISEMELAGVKLDLERWRELEKVVRKRRDEAALELDAQFPEPEGMLPLEGLGPRLNLNSPQQITDAFRSLGIELADTKVWTLLKVDHPAAKLLLKYRELQKKLGTYLETYPSFVSEKTGRIHANFLQCRVPTGRLACTSPNIQQVPHEEEFRRCFVAEQDNTLVIADYSQIELRILAEVSGDPAFVGAFRRGDDLHRVTAASMYGVPFEEVSKDQRSAAKRINFGLMYGRGAKSLSAQLGTDEEKARGLIDEYFASYPKVQRYLQGTASRAVRTRTLRTLAGRLRKFPDPAGMGSQEKGAMRREAMNYPIQGCLRGNSRVFEETRGYVPISSLVGHAVSVWDGERFSRASVVASGYKRLTRVVLKGGHEIECSPDHKFLVRNNNGGEAWKAAGEIRAQERVVLSNGLGKWELDLASPAATPGRSWNANTADLNEIGTREELGEWLGRVASDGWVNGRRGVGLLVAEHEEVLLPKLLSLKRRLGHVHHRTRVTDHQPKRLHHLTFSCAGLGRQMEDMGVKERVPDVAWRSRSVLCGYLRGLFDGDGTAHPDGPVLTFGGGDRHLGWAREVQEALLLLGIRSRIGVYETRINVRVMKKDTPLFCSQIGFMNPIKQGKTEAVVASPYKGKADSSAAYGRSQKVESVEVTDEWVEMYDVVNSETGRFAANGIVVHNSSADIAKLALVRLREELEGLDARLINSVHDEFVVECREDLADEVAGRMKRAMERAGEEILEKVPVEVEVAVSREWTK
jgi:DNA polymerase-1